jgi:hypothetical protein
MFIPPSAALLAAFIEQAETSSSFQIAARALHGTQTESDISRCRPKSGDFGLRRIKYGEYRLWSSLPHVLLS